MPVSASTYGPLVAAALAAAAAVACAPPATLPGCGKDSDCKGARVCMQARCVDPAPRPLPATPARVASAAAAPVAAPPAHDPAPEPLPPPPISPLGPSPAFHVDRAHTGRSRFRAPAAAPREVARVAVGGAVYGAPAIADDGAVVFGAHDRALYAVEPTRAPPGASVRWRRLTGDLVWAAPALGPGVVYAGSDDDRLYALDLKDGSVRWTFTAGPCRVATGVGPEGARCDVDGLAVAADGTIYAAADGLYAVRPDGTLKWKWTPGTTHCATAPAIGADGTVYVGCRDDALYAIGSDGQKRWELRTGDDVDSAPTLAPDGTVYFGSDDHKLYAVTPGGALKFAVVTGGPVRASPALGSDGTVYVGSHDGALYAVRPNGTVAWLYRTADRIQSSPLVDAAGLIVFGSQDDRLYALKPDGKLAWSVLLDGDVDGSPALAADGTIWVGADDKAMHALK